MTAAEAIASPVSACKDRVHRTRRFEAAGQAFREGVVTVALATPTHQDFIPHLHQTFRLQAGSEGHDIELIQVKALRYAMPGGRPPFSILFRGAREVMFPQMIYRIEHARMGALDLFIVPIGPDEQGMIYEAVFN